MKVLQVLGKNAYHPLSDSVLDVDEAGSKSDESMVHFPRPRLLDVAGLVKARKRRKSASVKGKAGAIKVGKPRYRAPHGSRIDFKGSGGVIGCPSIQTHEFEAKRAAL